jgi:hypothetical protein
MDQIHAGFIFLSIFASIFGFMFQTPVCRNFPAQKARSYSSLHQPENPFCSRICFSIGYSKIDRKGH